MLHNFLVSDGANPNPGLALFGDTLFGTANGGGSSPYYEGTAFALNTDGTHFSNLHNFTAPSPFGTNSDGTIPFAGLILSGTTLYGTASSGGGFGDGTIYKLNSDGTGFTTLYSFSSVNNNTNSDGAGPVAPFVMFDNHLYGTTTGGGISGSGTLFSRSLPLRPPHLMILSDGSGGYVIDVQGTPNLAYRLQRAQSLTGPWTTSAPQTAPASGLIKFHDLFPPPDLAFYRALQQ